MGQMKTPGVYIVEKNAFPNSVVEVATAVPAFIGYTEKAENRGKTLRNKPWRISSMAEFHQFFGGSPDPKFNIESSPGNSADEAEFSADGQNYVLKPTDGDYLLYRSMRLFFQNGGGPCHVVSVGDYKADIKMDELRKGIDPLIKEQEPTMVVIPDAMLLKSADECNSLQQAMLAHCGEKMKSRVAILDVYNGYQHLQYTSPNCIESFRNKLGTNFLNYAAAYYPWVNTTIVQESDVTYENIGNPEELQTLLRNEAQKNQSSKLAEQQQEIDNITVLGAAATPKEEKKGEKGKPEKPADASVDANLEARKKLLNSSLLAMSPLYGRIIGAIANRLNLMPPAAAMAGIYTRVDNSRGVWKAPANVSLSAVVSPAVNISHDEQEDLNVTTQGKSINAIRSFIGEGTLVWGARTLDGNSLDWRYVNVRRTMIMLEESIRLATKAYVFEPNDANTWVTIKSMIRNFLTGIWKRGGLAGAVPEDAFSVHVGLGETMTSEDILEGILKVTVLVAISRPAEFIEITFQQQMQKS